MAFLERCALIITLLIFSSSLFSQETLILSREESENLFLKENLLLLAEKLEIDQAEAQLLQAKLWPNPTLEIDEVNLWATQRQIDILSDELPSFGSGSFGKHQQFAASFEQLILTAGKRKKLMAIEEVSVEKSKQYFEDLLRSLKLEFRSQLTELQYLQLKHQVYQNQVASIAQLTRAYKNQLDQGHIAKGEYVRLKALELEIKKEIRELNKEINEVQKELKLLMRLPASTELKISDEGFLRTPEAISLASLQDFIKTAKESRPDYQLAVLEEEYLNNRYRYERASRIPDISLKVGYDRGGNILYDFVGFGLAIDLPIFDRNQGNIKSAQFAVDQSKLMSAQKALEIENDIVLAYNNLIDAIAFVDEIEPDYESDLDLLLESYTRNFTQRNISLLEYLDFFEAYLENKEIILEANKEVNNLVEELNFAIGSDLIN